MLRSRPHLLWLPLLIAALAGPGCEDPRGDDYCADCFDAGPVFTLAEGGGCNLADILFVIDNSGSMGQEQASLVQSFPQFIDVLEGYVTPDGGKLHYRVGVITTDPAHVGLLANQSCYGGEHPWADGPGEDVAGQFSCAASVGTSGSGDEMPFETLMRALGDQAAPGMPNDGFYRKHQQSLLVVVIITDEDDSSQHTSHAVVDFLDVLARKSDRYVVVAIAGPGPGNCESEFGSAEFAVKLYELVDLVDYGVFGDICAGDIWLALQEAMYTIQHACDNFTSE